MCTLYVLFLVESSSMQVVEVRVLEQKVNSKMLVLPLSYKILIRVWSDLIISSGLPSGELQLTARYQIQELWPRRRVICYWSGVRNMKKLTKTSHFKGVVPRFIQNSVGGIQITLPLCAVKYRTLPLCNGQYTCVCWWVLKGSDKGV
jgi:hypothetical protein